MHHAVVPALFAFCWKFDKLKNLQHAWILIIEKQNNDQKSEEWKDGGIYQKNWPLPPQV